MEKASASITIFQGDGSDVKLAHEHYAQLAMATQTECGTDYIAPAEEVFAKNHRDEGEKKKQEESLKKAQDELVRLFDQEEVGVKLKGGKKRQKMCSDLITGVIQRNIRELHTKDQPAKLFTVGSIASELREKLTESNFGQYVAMQKIEADERRHELRAATIIRDSFGQHFKEQVEGELNCMYATASIREVIRIFVASKVMRMDDGTKVKIKERIANLDGKRSEVQGIDAVVRLYRALEVAGDHVGIAEKKAILLNSIGKHISARAREAVSQLPLRYGFDTEKDGDYSFDSIVLSINKCRNTDDIFPLRPVVDDSPVAYAAVAGGQEGKASAGRPTGGSRQIVPEYEPQITDHPDKWKKEAICGYHFRGKNYTAEQTKAYHTNLKCKRDKTVFYENYNKLIAKLNKGK